MEMLFWLFVVGFVTIAFFAIVTQVGIAFFKAFFWVLLLPFKIVLGALGLLVWSLFLPLKLLLVLVLGVVAFMAVPVVATMLCLFGLLWVAC